MHAALQNTSTGFTTTVSFTVVGPEADGQSWRRVLIFTFALFSLLQASRQEILQRAEPHLLFHQLR